MVSPDDRGHVRGCGVAARRVSSAGFHLEVATADEAEADDHKVDAVWFLPDDPIGVAHIHLALIYLVRGDLFGAEAALARAARRAEQLAFPQGAFTLAYTRAMESWLSIEIGGLDRAAELAASVSELGERHGLDQWRLYGAPPGQCRRPGRTRHRQPRPGRPPRPHRHPEHAPRHLAHVRAEHLPHPIRRPACAAVDRRRPTRSGPRTPRHRAGAGPGHRDVLLRRRTIAASRPHPHRPRCHPGRPASST